MYFTPIVLSIARVMSPFSCPPLRLMKISPSLKPSVDKEYLAYVTGLILGRPTFVKAVNVLLPLPPLLPPRLAGSLSIFPLFTALDSVPVPNHLRHLLVAAVPAYCGLLSNPSLPTFVPRRRDPANVLVLMDC